MKRILICAAAALAFLQAQAQDWSQLRDLYRAGMYAETVSRLEGVDGAMADGYRALCALQLGTENAYVQAQHFMDNWPECVLVPQVRYLYALDLFDRQRFEEALQQFNLLN